MAADLTTASAHWNSKFAAFIAALRVLAPGSHSSFESGTVRRGELMQFFEKHPPSVVLLEVAC